MTQREKASKQIIQSLDKGLRVIEVFAQAERFLGLGEIVRLTGFDKSSAQRSTHTLVQAGYLEKDPRTGRFCLGKKVLDLSFNFLRSHPLVTAAMPVLLQLRRDSGERTNLSLFDRTTLIYAIRLHGKREAPQHSTLIGRRVPTYCTAGGRATLARLPDDEVQKILAASDLRRLTSDTLTDPKEILDKVREARELGYAFVKGEISPGELVVAAPVVDLAGSPIAAVHIAGAAGKWGEEEFQSAFAATVMEAARFLSHNGASAWPDRSGARGSDA